MKKRRTFLWGLRPQTPGIYRADANPSESSSPLGLSSSPNPSLVLAPESALSLLPSRDLSSAPAACSVSATAVLRNDGTKKELDYHSAFRHAHYRRSKMFGWRFLVGRSCSACAALSVLLPGASSYFLLSGRRFRAFWDARLEYWDAVLAGARNIALSICLFGQAYGETVCAAGVMWKMMEGERREPAQGNCSNVPLLSPRLSILIFGDY